MVGLVCSPDADITLRSSDGVHFKFYKKQLETHSAAFANPGFLLHVKDFLDLTETAAVLDLLLQFISCQKPPSLDITFTVLTSLAEAVEKYKIFSAIPPIETSMRYDLHIDSNQMSDGQLSEMLFLTIHWKCWNML